jgi:cobalamin synthase
MTPGEFETRRLRAILSWSGAFCAIVVLYAWVWDGPSPPDAIVWVCSIALTGCGAGLGSLRGKGLLSAYRSRLSAAERGDLDMINKQVWPWFCGMVGSFGALLLARGLHDYLAPYYRPVVLALAVALVLSMAGQLSLKRAERRLYGRVLPEDAA